MTGERIGAGAIAALTVSVLFLLVQVAVLIFGLVAGMTILTLFIPTAFAPLAALVQTLVVTPVWCVWLLSARQPNTIRRRRAITRSLTVSAATFSVTMLTWYLIYTAPYENLHIIPG